MLTAFRLGNFKAFADTQEIPIRPITLIFGANSSGKSSLIHGLILAHEANRTGKLDVFRTEIGGEAVDLGGFGQYVYGGDLTRRVEWSVELGAADLRGRIAELLAPIPAVSLSVEIGMQLEERTTSRVAIIDRQAVSVEDRELVPLGIPGIQNYEIMTEGESTLRMSRRPDGELQLDRLQHSHRIFQNVIKAIVETATTAEALQPEDLGTVESVIEDLVSGITAQIGMFLPERLLLSDKPIRSTDQAAIFPVSRGRRREDLTAAIRFFLPRALEDLVQGLNDVVKGEMKRLSYLVATNLSCG